jgi:hypothetical protein
MFFRMFLGNSLILPCDELWVSVRVDGFVISRDGGTELTLKTFDREVAPIVFRRQGEDGKVHARWGTNNFRSVHVKREVLRANTMV